MTQTAGRAWTAVALAGLTLMPYSVAAQTVNRDNGEAGATVLQLTTVPRAAALGDALTAASGVTGIFANAGAAASIDRFAAHAARQSLFDGSYAGAIAAGYRFRPVSVALGIQFLDFGSIEEVVCDGCGGRGTPTGRTLSASELAIRAAGAIRLLEGRASVGAGVDLFSSDLAGESASQLAVSVGGRLRLDPRLTVAAAVQHLGGSVEQAAFAAPLPRTLRAGLEVTPLAGRADRVHLVIAADLIAVRGAPTRVGGGVEAGIAPDPSRLGLGAVARVGLSSTGDDFAGQALRFGGGVRLLGITLDYAFQGSDALGDVHRVGLTIER